MNTKQNLHVHTTYADGTNKPEQLIGEAIKKGFGSIGFSEHTYNKFSIYPYQLPAEKMGDYKAEILALKKKYAGQIDIFCGLEDEFVSEVCTDDYDYLIGSVHYLECDGKICGFDSGLKATCDYIKEHFDGNALAFAKKYYETLCLLPQKKQYDILGHFDLITKNNEKGNFIDVTSKEYLNYGFEAIHALKGKIPFFEVNTGAISRGYRTAPYPQMEFLKEFKNCGFGVVITSDCHDRNFIDCFYDEAHALSSAAGFKTKWILTDNGFTEVEL